VSGTLYGAADRDHPFLADPPLHRQHRVVGVKRQGQQIRSLLGKMVVHDPLRGGMTIGISAKLGNFHPAVLGRLRPALTMSRWSG
jgi:hypothetical protein